MDTVEVELLNIAGSCEHIKAIISSFFLSEKQGITGPIRYGLIGTVEQVDRNCRRGKHAMVGKAEDGW
jgi:hypothetical protein